MAGGGPGEEGAGMPRTSPRRSSPAARAGRWSAQHRRAAILGWIAFVVAAVVLGGAAGFKESADDGVGESGRADAAMTAHFRSDRPEETVLVSSAAHTTGGAAF